MSDNHQSLSERRRSRRRYPSIFWPMLLIGAGILLLLRNLEFISWESWYALGRFWPVLLIVWGIDMLFGRRSLFGFLINAVLILLLLVGVVLLVIVGGNMPAVSHLITPTVMHLRHIEYPLGDEVTRANVQIDWSSLPGKLTSLDTAESLIAGDIAYQGELMFDVHPHKEYVEITLDHYASGAWVQFPRWGREDYRWDVRLTPHLPLALSMDTGSGVYELDLAGLQVVDLFLDAGSGSVTLTLPAQGGLDGRIEGGSGPLRIVLPDGMEARVVREAGSGSFHVDQRLRLVEGQPDDDGIWETDGFDEAGDGVLLRIEQGSGGVWIE